MLYSRYTELIHRTTASEQYHLIFLTPDPGNDYCYFCIQCWELTYKTIVTIFLCQAYIIWNNAFQAPHTVAATLSGPHTATNSGHGVVILRYK